MPHRATRRTLHSIAAQAAGGTEIVLQPDAAAGYDSRMGKTATAINTNFGTATQMYFRASGSNDEHPIIKFDVSSVPSGATVVSATLSIYISSIGGTDANKRTDWYEVLRNWVESEVTWNIYSTGNNWTTGGADGIDTDRTDESVAYIADGAHVAGQFNDWVFNSTGIALVQQWVDGGDNYGIVGRQTEGNNDKTIDLYTSDHTTANQRPKLTIVYS